MGLEFELLPSGLLPPISATTTRPDGNENAVIDGCATPTSAMNVLPAPRKNRPAKRKLHHLSRCRCGSAAPQPPAPVRRWFITVPYDVLAAAFVARRPDSACRPPAGKKIHVHAVG